MLLLLFLAHGYRYGTVPSLLPHPLQETKNQNTGERKEKKGKRKK